MSRELFSRNQDLKQLRDEGYFVQQQGGYLVMREVPYVDAHRQVRTGTLISSLTLAGDHCADNFAIASDGNGGALLVLNQETPTPVTNESDTFTTATSQVYQTHGALEGSGLSINSTDNSSSDLVVAELNQTSSILTSNGDGIDMTSLAAGIVVDRKSVV